MQAVINHAQVTWKGRVQWLCFCYGFKVAIRSGNFLAFRAVRFVLWVLFGVRCGAACVVVDVVMVDAGRSCN
jgi:hypothetical protein